MKTLKQVLGDLGGYSPKAEGEKEFVKKHVVAKHDDANGNGDEVFKASKVKVSDRPGERHGFTDEDDNKVYEEAAPEEKKGAKKVVDILRKYKVVDKPQLKETVMDTVKHPKLGEIKWKNEGGFHAITTKKANGSTTFHAIGTHKQIADKWAQLKKALSEGVEEIAELSEEFIIEGQDARARFEEYHKDTSELLKKISDAVKGHKDSVHKDGTHWGHVGDIKHFHRQLQDLHDQITQTGEYQRAVSGVREETELQEKHLTAAEKKKREEIAQAIERENPGMDMGKKMAIATAKAKQVAESKEDKKTAKGKGVPASGVYDSIPLGITVSEDASEEDINTSLLEMFVALDEEEKQMFVEMLDQDSALLSELTEESK